jgi:hypothetical protein
MKIYKYGKDQETLPCIELDGGSIHTEIEIILALVKALIRKGVITQQQIKDEL